MGFMLWTRARSHCLVYYDMVEYKKGGGKCSEQQNCASHRGMRLCDIRKRIPRAIHSFNVLLFKKRVDCLLERTSASAGLETSVTHLLDVRNLGGKPLRDLRDDFLYQRLVLHRLTRLHDAARRVSRASIQWQGRRHTGQWSLGSHICDLRRQS